MRVDAVAAASFRGVFQSAGSGPPGGVSRQGSRNEPEDGYRHRTRQPGGVAGVLGAGQQAQREQPELVTVGGDSAQFLPRADRPHLPPGALSS